MPCFHPLRGYRARVVGPSGKRSVVFNPRHGFHDMPVDLPCGQCIGCRLERSRQWAMRCVHEASLYDASCFVTLTYDDEHLPEFGSLRKRDFQLFMKRLRKEFSDERIRFFHCGEYGGVTARPHYHALLFGFDFPDKVVWTTRSGLPVWRSSILERLWPVGLSEIGSVTFESAAYVARYIVKKVTGEAAEDHYLGCEADTGEVGRREAEYVTMSRRPGIAREWFERFGSEVFPADSVVMRGKEMKPPRYYVQQLEAADPDVAEAVAAARRCARRREEETEERLVVREVVAKAQLNLKRRALCD